MTNTVTSVTISHSPYPHIMIRESNRDIGIFPLNSFYIQTDSAHHTFNLEAAGGSTTCFYDPDELIYPALDSFYGPKNTV